MAAQRQRSASRERAYDPAAVKRWNRAYKLKAYGLTPERFARMLVDQNNACAMCFTPFPEGQMPRIDHDHACCPGEKSSCGRCIRGLLCVSCNTALGIIERRYELARAYLNRAKVSQVA